MNSSQIKHSLNDLLTISRTPEGFLKALRRIRDDCKEVVEQHDNYISSDDQYEDPELWWSRPLLQQISEIHGNMEEIIFELNNSIDDLNENV